MRSTKNLFVAKYKAGAVALLSVAFTSHFAPIDSWAFRSKRPLRPALQNKMLFLSFFLDIVLC